METEKRERRKKDGESEESRQPPNSSQSVRCVEKNERTRAKQREAKGEEGREEITKRLAHKHPFPLEASLAKGASSSGATCGAPRQGLGGTVVGSQATTAADRFVNGPALGRRAAYFALWRPLWAGIRHPPGQDDDAGGTGNLRSTQSVFPVPDLQWRVLLEVVRTSQEG